MIIWMSFIIPIITAIVLYIFFKRKMAWYEYLCLFLFSAIAIVVAKGIIERVRTTDTEIWGEYIMQVRYYEPWDEYIHQTCTRTVGSGKDEHTETYDCSYVENHPAQYVAVSNSSNEYYIEEYVYQYYKKLWYNNHFVDMHRDYYSVNGNMYNSDFNTKMNDMYPYFTTHTFENRIKASSSIFNDTEVDTSIYKNLPVYPVEKKHKADAYVYGKEFAGQNIINANRELANYNALLGASKQVRMIVVLLKNRPMDYSNAIRRAWSNGKKNELIVCVDVDDSLHIDWADIISGTESEALKINLRNDILDLKHLCYPCLNTAIITDVSLYWQRKHFKDFAYLTIEPTQGQLMISVILILLFNIGMSVVFVKNNLNSKTFEQEE